MNSICKITDCTGCGACVEKCPAKAITMKFDSEGFLYPSINENCINCDACKLICPQNREYLPNQSICDAYLIQILDKNLLKQSTSGGAFILLSQYVLNMRGVVFGATYDENMYVRHTYAEVLEDVFPMQGSKYVQSDAVCSYKQVEKFLKAERWVLFSGTPCQIEGLKCFLGKEYEKLICLDIICGGVPSPRLFSEYIKFIQKKNHSRVVDYKFRDKFDYGCSHTTVIYEKINDAVQRTVIPQREKISYYVAFGKQAFVRPSCYDCKYNCVNRNSDFTCGGYWGGKAFENLSDYEGISTFIIHTEKGRNIFEAVKSNIKYEKITVEDAKDGNSMLYSSMPSIARVSQMFSSLEKYGYKKTAKKYFPVAKSSIVKKIIPLKLKRWILKYIIKRSN